MNMKTQLLMFTLLSLLGSSVAFAEVAVIVNASSGVSSLSQNDVKRIFLGKSKKLPDGSNVKPVDLTSGSDRDAFYNSVTGKNAAQLKSYWSTMIFSGKGVPPKEIGSSEDVSAWVAKNPNGIGYVNKSAVGSGVKTVLVVK